LSPLDPDVEGRVVRAVGSIGLATLLSRVLGYARDMALAAVFGAGPVTDAFLVAFRIPNLLRRLLAEGALATAVIPVLGESLARDSREAFHRLTRAVAGAGVITLTVAAGLGMLLSPWVVRVMTPGWAGDPATEALAVWLTRLMFPYLVLVGLAALASGILNVHHRFFSAALAPAILNVSMILGALFLSARIEPPITALAVGVLAGGLGQFLVQVPELGRLGVPLAPSAEWRHPAVMTIARRLVPVTFGLAGAQVTVLVNTILASLLPQGSVSYLYYADRVMEFPLGVFGIALATASLPTMSAQAARGEHQELRGTLAFTLRLATFVAVPAALGLLVLGTPIVRLLFERGSFSAAESAATARALAAYAVGLPAFSATRIAAQVFYALGDTRTPVIIGLGAVAVNVVLALGLMWPLGHAGLALASSLSAYVQLALLLGVLRRRLGSLGARPMRRSLGRTLAAAAPLTVWCAWIGPAGGPDLASAARTGLAIAGGAALFIAAAALLRAPELAALVTMLRRRRATLPSRAGE
jgi:putative peptidoglycan lipid II flippase